MKWLTVWLSLVEMHDINLNFKTGLAAGDKLACRIITRIVNRHPACNEDKPVLPRNAWQKQKDKSDLDLPASSLIATYGHGLIAAARGCFRCVFCAAKSSFGTFK